MSHLLETQILDAHSGISLDQIVRLYRIYYWEIVILLYSNIYQPVMLNRKRHIMKDPIAQLDCEICLWCFGTKSELDVHNYLEHLIINDVRQSRIVQDVRVITHG